MVEYFKRITKKLFENNENKSPAHVVILTTDSKIQAKAGTNEYCKIK